MPGLPIAGNPRFSYTLNVISYLKINLCQSNIATTWTSFIAASCKLFWKRKESPYISVNQTFFYANEWTAFFVTEPMVSK